MMTANDAEHAKPAEHDEHDERNEDEMSRTQRNLGRRTRRSWPCQTSRVKSLAAFLGLCLLLASLSACGAVSVTLTREVPVTTPALRPSRTPTSAPVQTVAASATTAATARISQTPVPTQAAATPTLAGASLISASPTPPGVESADDFKIKVDALLADVPAHVGIVVARPDGTVLYQQEADTQFESASLYKLAIMAEIYRERDAGDLTFDDLVTLYPGFFYEDDSVYGYDENVYDQIPVGTLLDNMIMLSSNVAANALLYLAGTDRVNAMAESIGMSNTKILWYPVADRRPHVELVSYTAGASKPSGDTDVSGAYNVTTPADISLFFEKLVQGQVVSASTSAEMLDLLARQEINDRLPALLPDGTRVAHKTGDLDNSVHDAGVIYGPDGPVVVAILSDQVDNRAAVVSFMQQVALLAYALSPE